MVMSAKRKTTWVLIADGSRARILYTTSGLEDLSPVEDKVFRNSHPRLQDILSDRPGRTFDSVGAGRHAMAYSSDARREDERAFATRLGAALQESLRSNGFDQLVIVAAPRMLGDLRDKLPADVRKTVKAEIAKDLTHVPNPEIPALLEADWAG